MKKQKKAVSLGLSLTQTYVEAALVESVGKQMTLLKAGRYDLPPGVVQGGKIRNAQKLASTIRSLLRREGIHRKRVTVCLPDCSMLTQILELPREIPSNLHQYIRSEIRHSPLLTGHEPIYDFISLGESDHDVGRLFVGAADRERIDDLIRVLHSIGLEAEAIEIGTAAVLRALHRGTLGKLYDRNLMIADLRGDTLTVCMLVKEQIDFIRRTVLNHEADVHETVLKELLAIRQFYEIEKELFFDTTWLCVFVSDRDDSGAESRRQLLEQRLGVDVLYSQADGLMRDVNLTVAAKQPPVSACTAGLTMRPFERGKYIGGLNFLPEKTRQFYQAKRLIRKTLIASACTVILMFLMAVLSHVRIDRLSAARASGPAQSDQTVMDSMQQKRKLETELRVYREEARYLETLLETAPEQKWANLLREIQQRIPHSLWISSLEADSSGRITIQGQTLNHSCIYQFADLLKKSELISEAEIAESRISPESSMLLEYRILCQLGGMSKGDETQ